MSQRPPTSSYALDGLGAPGSADGRGGAPVIRAHIDRDRLHVTFDRLLTLFAVLVLPAMLFEAVAPDEREWRALAEGMDWFIWVGFAISVAGAISVARHHRAAVRSHAVDVLLVVLTPPVVPETWQALRALRTLRLVRLVLAGFRLHQHMRRLSRKSVVGPAALVLIVVMLAAATAIRTLEPDQVTSVGQGMWWALSRATALGDGGVVLQTVPARVVEVIVVISGLAFLSLITAAIATVFVQAEESQDPEMSKLAEISDRLERSSADWKRSSALPFSEAHSARGSGRRGLGISAGRRGTRVSASAPRTGMSVNKKVGTGCILPIALVAIGLTFILL